MANMQHNCQINKCKYKETSSIFQEQEEFKGCTSEIVHINPDDLILNCAKM